MILSDSQNNLLAGLRLCIFEVVWPKAWLEGVEIKDLNASSFVINAVTVKEPSSQECNDFSDRLDEMFAVAFEGQPYSLKLHRSNAPGEGFVKLMNETIFRRIA